jgi:opacity protein-like surface antigen
MSQEDIIMRIWKYAIVMMSLCSPYLYASEQNHECCENKYFAPVIALTGGMAINSDAGASQNFPIGYSQLDYDTHHETEIRGVFGGFLGTEFSLLPIWSLQLGVAYYQTTPFAAEGLLAQGVNPATTAKYEYNYKIISHQALVEGKLLLKRHERFHPYISAGLGAAFNQAKDFNVYFPPTLAMTPQYDDHTTTSFTYNVGLGFDVDISEHFRIGLGYRFTDLGKANLGNGEYDQFDPTSISSTLEQSHLYTQEVLAQLTYIM